MKKLFIFFIVCQLIFVNTITIIAAETQDLFTREMEETDFSLLDNRLFMEMPKGSANVPMQNGIMAPTSSSHEETRLMSQLINGQRIVVYAKELFVTSSGDLKEDARILWERMSGDKTENYRLSEIESQNGLDIVKVFIDNPNINSDAILIDSAFVKMSDNTIIFLGFYVNPMAFRWQENCLELTDTLVSTLRAGARTLNLSAHEETIYNLNFNLKKDYILTQQQGTDFDVFYIKKVVPVTSYSPSMGIYLGWHPSFSEEVEGFQDSHKNIIKGSILDIPVEWLYYDKDGGLVDIYSYMQTLISLDSGAYMHVFIYPTSEEDLEEMKMIAESLTFTK